MRALPALGEVALPTAPSNASYAQKARRRRQSCRIIAPINVSFTMSADHPVGGRYHRTAESCLRARTSHADIPPPSFGKHPTAASFSGDPVLGNNPLYYERWAELFNEGQWWFDVCRWHLGQSEAAFYVTARTLSGNNFQWNDKAYAWPIPLTEINSNPKVANQQNPKY